MLTMAVEHRIDPLSEKAPTPAPYGHACASCAQSKCRCILHRPGGPCERCHRLNKECRPAEKARRRVPRRLAVSKTARLEEKLDGLVSLIKAGQSGRDVISSSMDGSIHQAPVLTPPTDGSTTSPYPTSLFQDTSGDPSPIEAEACLFDFKTYHLKYFPFIHIPSATTAQELQQERPFLWLCIVAVSSKSTARQQVMSTKIRQTVAQEMLVQSERNIDLLLGILIFIGWGHYQVNAKPFLGVFSQLACSLVFDLGLNRSVPKENFPVPGMKEKCCARPLGPRTMEQRRAVLGCFLITSVIASFLQKIDAFRWTLHMNECLQIIDEEKECPNDAILVKLVRMQLIAENTMLDIVQNGADGSIEHANNPASLFLETLCPQLQEYKTRLLAQPQTDKIVLLHLYNIELETALSPAFLYTHHLTLQQHENINAAFEAIKSWSDVFSTIPPKDYIGFSFPVLSQLLRCLVTLYRLKSPEHSDGEANSVGKTIDLLRIVDLVINNMEQVPICARLEDNENPGTDVFSRSGDILRSLRPIWEAGMSSVDSSTMSHNNVETFPPNPLTIDFSENNWFMNIFLNPYN